MLIKMTDMMYLTYYGIQNEYEIQYKSETPSFKSDVNFVVNWKYLKIDMEYIQSFSKLSLFLFAYSILITD